MLASMAFTPVELTRDGKTEIAETAAEEVRLRFDGWLPTGTPPVFTQLDENVADLVEGGTETARRLKAAFAALPTDALTGGSLYGYGHSYMAGVGASDSDHHFLTQLGNLIGAANVQNHGVGGSTMPRTMHTIANLAAGGWTPGTAALVVLMSVINDALIDGAASPAKRAQDLLGFQNALRTALRILRCSSYVPNSDASIAYAGSWVADGSVGISSRTGTIRKANAAGSTATIAGYTATEITITALSFMSESGTLAAFMDAPFTVTVDGTTYATQATANQGSYHDLSLGDGDASHQLNSWRVTGLPAGSKSVVVTSTSNNNFWFDGYLTPPINPPSVLVTQDAPVLADDNGWLRVLNGAIAAIVAEPEFGGPNETRAVAAGFGYDPATMLTADSLHRNDTGHLTLAHAHFAQAATLPYRRGLR